MSVKFIFCFAVSVINLIFFIYVRKQEFGQSFEHMLYFKICFIKKHNPHETTSLKFFQPEIFGKLKRTLYMLYHLVLFTI